MIRTATVQHMPGGEQAVNVLNFGGSSTSELPDVVDKVETFFSTIKAFMSAAWGVDRIDAGVWDPGPPQSAPTQYSRVPTTAIFGTASGNPMPNQIALCVSFRGSGFTRHDRGRCYLGGFTTLIASTGGSGESLVSDSYAIQIAEAFADMAGPASDPNRLVVKSAGSLSGSTVSEGYVETHWDTQRRRARSLPRDTSNTFVIS